MSHVRLYLFDDGRARRWAPVSLTRPIGEVMFGASRLRARSEATVGAPCAGHISRGALSGFAEDGAPPVVALDSIDTESPTVLLSSRVVLKKQIDPLPEGPARIVLDGMTVGWIRPAGADRLSDLWLRDPATAPEDGPNFNVAGSILDNPWDLVERNADQLRADLEGPASSSLPEGVVRIGSGRISLGDEAQVEPGVVLDTRTGPIHLGDRVRVEGPARLVGPLFVGDDSMILGGPIGSSSIGRRCKVRGELYDSVLGDFVNKAHEGHIGHALVGSWVNLGAGTTNSDLKNNYGSVTVWTPDGDVDTGNIKVGCFLGDHVKTGIGTLLNTGTVVGAGSNLFGGAMPPVAVPPFSWGSGSELTTYRIDKFLETAAKAMERRGVTLTESMSDLFARAWSLTESQRAE